LGQSSARPFHRRTSQSATSKSLLLENQDVQAILWDFVPGETVKLIPVSAFLKQADTADADT
jgi:hypothetical protein